MNLSSQRFVVLEHRQRADQIPEQRRRFLGGTFDEQNRAFCPTADDLPAIDVHFDLMLQSEGRLLTWAMPVLPHVGHQCPAVQLPPHRIDYLDYQGPVSNNRGSVRRVMSGQYDGDGVNDSNRVGAGVDVTLFTDNGHQEIQIMMRQYDPQRFLFRFG